MPYDTRFVGGANKLVGEHKNTHAGVFFLVTRQNRCDMTFRRFFGMLLITKQPLEETTPYRAPYDTRFVRGENKLVGEHRNTYAGASFLVTRQNRCDVTFVGTSFVYISLPTSH